MVMSADEKKARRVAGMQAAKDGLTAVERIQRALINGRPPASELKTPTAAVTAARILHRDLESRMGAEELTPTPGDLAVCVAYITADLSVLGFTPPFAPGREAGLMQMLDGNIMLGLIFGMWDGGRFVMGARPFLATKQTDTWLSELVAVIRMDWELDKPLTR